MSRLFYVSGPSINTQQGYWLYDFFHSEGYTILAYSKREEGRRNSRMKNIWKTIQIISSILLKSKAQDKIFYYDLTSDALYLGLILSYLRSKRKIYLMNFMGGDTADSYTYIKKKLIRKAFSNIIVSVNNKQLAECYSHAIGVSLTSFYCIPDCTAEYGKVLVNIDIEDQGYVFMGGNTRRDFELFVKTAQELTQIPFIVVTSNTFEHDLKNAPPNVKVFFDIDFRQFISLIARSRIVFIPLISDTQGGQLVLFQGALLKKALVTTDNLAIRTYFGDNEISIIERGNLNASVSIVKQLFNDPLKCRELGINAFQSITKFAPEQIFDLIRNFLQK